jgi:hypothetical protein
MAQVEITKAAERARHTAAADRTCSTIGCSSPNRQLLRAVVGFLEEAIWRRRRHNPVFPGITKRYAPQKAKVGKNPRGGR